MIQEVGKQYVYPPEGFIQGKRMWLPRHVTEMTKTDRKFWVMENGVEHIHMPHWDGPGTNFTGLETLASMTVDGVASTPATSPGKSILTTECLVPVAPQYMARAGSRLWCRAYGTVLATAVIPTFQLQAQYGPTYANPLTSGQMVAQHAAITPGAAVTHQFWLDFMMTVRAVGASGSIRGVGLMLNDILTAGTLVNTVFQNTALDTAPTAVIATGAGGLLVPIFFDLSLVLGAATAGNSITCLDYSLCSLN